MGRFGNVFLIGGDPDLRLEAAAGEVVRLWLTNTANTRVFNVPAAGGADEAGRRGQRPGRARGVHRPRCCWPPRSGRWSTYWSTSRASWPGAPHPGPDLPAGHLTVTEEQAAPSPAAASSSSCGGRRSWRPSGEQLDRWLAAPPDKVLALVAQMDDPAAMPAGAGPVTYACPMHPEVTSDQPGRCPKCGMKLLAVDAAATS